MLGPLRGGFFFDSHCSSIVYMHTTRLVFEFVYQKRSHDILADVYYNNMRYTHLFCTPASAG